MQQSIILVTGGSRGIGRALVESFAASGATVLFTYQKQSAADRALSDACEAQQQSVRGFQLDAKDVHGTQELFDLIEKEYGRLDVLVNNAAITRDALLVGMEDEDWQVVIDTNLHAYFRFARAAARLMLLQRRGVIINVSSIAATRPAIGHSNYVAAKAGIEGMSQALALELASRQIRVNCVAPGIIATDMSQDLLAQQADRMLMRIPMKRFGSVEDVVQAVRFLASDAAAYITGTVLRVDGGMSI